MNETVPLKRGIVAALHDTEKTIREAIEEIELLVRGEIAQDAEIDRLRAANEHERQLHGKLQSRIGSLLDENSRLALTVDGLEQKARDTFSAITGAGCYADFTLGKKRVLVVRPDATFSGYSHVYGEADLVINTNGAILKNKGGSVEYADTQRLRAEWKRHKAKMATPERGDLVEVVSFAWKGRSGRVTDAEGDFRTVTFSSGGKCLFHARDLKVIEKAKTDDSDFAEVVEKGDTVKHVNGMTGVVINIADRVAAGDRHGERLVTIEDVSGCGRVCYLKHLEVVEKGEGAGVMTDVRTYAVSVDGREPGLYGARSASKARYLAWLAFHDVWPDETFLGFQRRVKARVVPDAHGAGDRIVVLGKPATRVHQPGTGELFARARATGQTVWFVYDDDDVVRNAHPSDVAPAVREEAR